MQLLHLLSRLFFYIPKDKPSQSWGNSGAINLCRTKMHRQKKLLSDIKIKCESSDELLSGNGNRASCIPMWPTCGTTGNTSGLELEIDIRIHPDTVLFNFFSMFSLQKPYKSQNEKALFLVKIIFPREIWKQAHLLEPLVSPETRSKDFFFF